MTIAVAQYLEALTSTDGRFRTLDRVWPVRDAAGEPVFVVSGARSVDFEIFCRNERATLRCPLRTDDETMRRLWDFAERDFDLDCRFFTAWHTLPDEMVLFDETGRAFEVDILMRPAVEGLGLADFLNRAAARDDWDATRTACENAEKLLHWASLCDRFVSPVHMVVTPSGEVVVTDFSATDHSAAIRIMLGRAHAATLNPDDGYRDCEILSIDPADRILR